MREITVDNFAGGGGASTGIEIATGRSVDIAINHDPEAIRMHKANHPTTKHYCESVWDVDPVEVCNGRSVALAWFSPDCKHFSKAKGGKPKDKNIRGLAWVALRWAGLVRPRVIMLENVEEFKTWGPLNRRRRPVKAKQGETFEKFLLHLRELGYQVECQELIAADYGAPTMRKRFFMVARCDGQPIVWPDPTHAPRNSDLVKTGLLQSYVGAFTQIDFNRPCPSIFDSAKDIKSKYGIRAQRPLAEKTMQRIARGLQKFVIDNPEPFIVQCNHGGERKPHDIKEPMPTITGKHGFGVIEPYIVQIGQTGFSKDRSKDLRDPLTTIVSKNEHCLIEPSLRPHNQYADESSIDEDAEWEQLLRVLRIVNGDLDFMGESQDPLSTPYIMCNNENNVGASTVNPLPTITTANRNYLMTPTLIQYHSETTKQGVRGQDVEEPIMTVDASNRYGLVSAFIQKYFDGGYKGAGADLEKPLPTVTSVDHNSLCTAHIVKLKGENIGQDIEEPLQTITASGKHFGNICADLRPVSMSYISQMQGKSIGKDIQDPINTMTGTNHMAEVRAFLIKYYGAAVGQNIESPLDTVTAHDRFGLITIEGTDYAIVDIGLRMLEPKELYGCQGFPEDYIIDQDYTGKSYPRSEQVKRCGNAVCPPIPAALVKANLPELCTAERTPNIRIEQEDNGQMRLA